MTISNKPVISTNNRNDSDDSRDCDESNFCLKCHIRGTLLEQVNNLLEQDRGLSLLFAAEPERRVVIKAQPDGALGDDDGILWEVLVRPGGAIVFRDACLDDEPVTPWVEMHMTVAEFRKKYEEVVEGCG